MTTRPNSDPSAEMGEVLTEFNKWFDVEGVLVPHDQRSGAMLRFAAEKAWIAAWERARAILSAIPESGWISVKDRMPKPNRVVLAALVNPLSKRRVIRAQYAPPNTLPVGDDADDDAGTYDEATDTYYVAAGWYEDNEYEDTHWRVSDEVTYWTALPAHPDAPVSQPSTTEKKS